MQLKKVARSKSYFVNKDVNEKGLRMKLNFGHTFAHAIEVKNNFQKNNSWRSCFIRNDFSNKIVCFKKICSKIVLRN